jgi:excisionase family DNA binding protein
VSLYTASEVAAKLKVKTVTVIRLFDSGALPGVVVRQGARKRVLRFREEALEEFLTSREKRGSRAEGVSDARAHG